MPNMDRLQVDDVCRACTANGCATAATEGFAPSGFSVLFQRRFSANGLTTNITRPAATARPIHTPHPGPEQTWDDFDDCSACTANEETCAFVSTVCSLLFSWKTVSFAAASSAFSASIFCWRTAAPLRPASCFLRSFVFTAVWRGNVFSACSGCSESIVVVSTRCNIIVEAVVFNMTPVTVLSRGQRSG